jgi:hypothetical protein
MLEGAAIPSAKICEIQQRAETLLRLWPDRAAVSEKSNISVLTRKEASRFSRSIEKLK